VTAVSAHTTIKAHANSKFASADNGGASALIANRAGVGAWEKFQVVVTNPDGSVSLKANANGKFVCADLGKGGTLIANRTTAAAWESFDLGTG